MTVLEVRPLTREAFAPFGDVIETRGSHHFPINNGTTERFHDLAAVDVADGAGKPLISIFRGQPFEFPIPITMVERHPLGSQAFIPLSGLPYLVVVATGEPEGAPGPPQAFLGRGTQGVNYAKGVWHHPLLALEQESDFVVVDRGGEGANLEEFAYAPDRWIIETL